MGSFISLRLGVSEVLFSVLPSMLYLIYCNCLAKTGVDMIFIIVLVYRVVMKSDRLITYELDIILFNTDNFREQKTSLYAKNAIPLNMMKVAA